MDIPLQRLPIAYIEFIAVLVIGIQIFSTFKKTTEKNLVAEHPSDWLHVHSPRLDNTG